jgi:hypothetical protein
LINILHLLICQRNSDGSSGPTDHLWNIESSTQIGLEYLLRKETQVHHGLIVITSLLILLQLKVVRPISEHGLGFTLAFSPLTDGLSDKLLGL